MLKHRALLKSYTKAAKKNIKNVLRNGKKYYLCIGFR